MKACLISVIGLIRKSDFLGESPKLKVDGSSSFKTFIGGLISIILIILSFIGVGYFGKNYSLKKILWLFNLLKTLIQLDLLNLA